MGGLRKRLYDILNAPAKKESILETRKETRGRAYGATAIAQVFKGADFPMSKNDIMNKYGDREIEYHKGRKEKVHDVLGNIPDENYNSTVEIEQAFHETKEGTKSGAYGTTGSGVYGATAIAQVFKGADFPMSKNDIMNKYGDREIEYHKGRKEKVHDILENIPDEKFNSTVELEQAFHETLKKRK